MGRIAETGASAKEMNAVMQSSSGAPIWPAALDLAFVAAGRYDGFWERGLSLWDIAAGILLVREAGGLVSDFASRDKALEQAMACNGAMHASLLKTLRGARA